MTLIELLIGVFTVAGAVTGAILGAKHGVLWGLGGFALGGVTGYLLFVIVMSPIVWLLMWFGLPDCCAGSRSDKHLLRRTSSTHEGTIWRCDCGKTYFETCARLTSGKRFLEVLPDGVLRPCMRRGLLGRWKPDTETTPPVLAVKLNPKSK